MKRGDDAQKNSSALNFEYELDAPLAKVWRALTIPEYVAQWLGLPNAEGPPPLSVRLLDIEPDRSVRYHWREEERTDWANLVTFHVTPNAAGGTTFRIIHERIAPARAANSNRPRMLLAA